MMNRWTRRNGCAAFLLCGFCVLFVGCANAADESGEIEAYPEDDFALGADPTMVDTVAMHWETTEETVGGFGPPDENDETAPLPGTIERERPVAPERPAPLPGIIERERPVPPEQRVVLERPAPVDTVRVVHGTAEIDLGRGRYARAAHVRVRLANASHRRETLVGRDGEFFFERVPVGRYRLQVLPLRETSLVTSMEIEVEPGDVVTLPPIRIAPDAVTALPRAPM
jgi:hypothetical protein